MLAEAFLSLMLASASAAAREPGADGSRAIDTSGSAARTSGTTRPTDAAAARGELEKQLLALADWCNQNELFLARDNAWRNVLALDPNNLDARKGLRYARNADGSWKEPAPREVKDRNPKALAELPKRRADAIGAYRDTLLAGLDEEHADAAKRESTYAEILSIDPDDEKIRALRGETKVEAAWLLNESASGKTRRGELKSLVQQGKAAKLLDVATPAATEADLAFLSPWKFVLAAEGACVLAQTSEAEAREMLQVVHTARELARTLLGTEAKLPIGFTVYVVGDPADREKFAAKLTDASEDERKSWKDSSGIGLPHGDGVVLWHKDPKKRLDCFTRHVVAKLLRTGFGIDSRQGWAFEGLGQYLTRELVGTRATWFILAQSGAAQDSLRGKLLSPESNWMAETLRLFKSATPPKLGESLAKELGALKIEDMLVVYSFSAYLVEGCPKELPEILVRTGSGAATTEVIAAVLHRPFPEVEARFVRWLEERK